MSSATNEGRIKKNSNKNQSRLHLLLTLISPLNKAIDLKQQVSLAYAYQLCLFLSEPKSQTNEIIGIIGLRPKYRHNLCHSH